jgi:hypothetical protein
MEHYYTAREAASRLGLKYHTFLLHVRNRKYTCTWFGRSMAFEKTYIDSLVPECS